MYRSGRLSARELRGNGGDIVKEYNFGGTRVKIVSKLAHLSDKERADYMQEQYEKGNPIYKAIEEAVRNCYRKEEPK